MPLLVTCPTCRHEYKLADQLAGRTLRCDRCGGMVAVPAAPGGGTWQPRAAPQVVSSEDYSAPAQPADFAKAQPLRAVPAAPRRMVAMPSTPRTGDVSPARRWAGRICITLSILTFLAGTCLGGFGGLGTLGAGSAAAGTSRNLALGIMLLILVCGVLMIGAAVTYLICGIKIRRSAAAAKVALIIACIHELAVLGWISYVAITLSDVPVPRETAAMVILAIVVLVPILFAASLGQLIYFLIKVVKEA